MTNNNYRPARSPGVSRRRQLSTASAILLGLFLAGLWQASAQETIIDEPVIDGFELHRKGVHWWSNQGRCSGSFPVLSTIRFQPTIPSDNYTQARSCLINQGTEYNVVRDDLEFYFFSAGQLHHKALWDSTAAPSTPLTTSPATPTLSDQLSTPLELANGRLYWGTYISSVGWNIFNRMASDGKTPPEQLAVILDGGSPVRQLKFMTSYETSTSKTVDGLIVLLRNGKLYHCKFTTGTGELLAENVTDFAVHTRYLLLANPITSIYAAQGITTASATAPPGRVIRIDADTKASTTIYTASGHNQIIAVATDSDQLIYLAGSTSVGPRNIYITEAVVGNCPLCLFVHADILKHQLPVTGGDWTTLTSTYDGSNLRSDDKYLYYREAIPGSVKIRRIDIASGPYQLDYEADGLEVVQASQDLDNSFRLVKNRPTFVRGYARVAADSASLPSRRPTARLYGWNGSAVPLPGSPLVPLKSPPIDGTTSLDDRRADLNRSFLFQLPDSWVNDKITLRLIVNPFRSDAEKTVASGTDAYANNEYTIFPGLTVYPKGDPAVVLVPILTHAPLYDPESPDAGLWDIAARARSLLPINQFSFFKSKHFVAKPVVRTCWDVPPICTSLEPFDLPDNDSTALFWLGALDSLSKDPPSTSGDVHWVGTVHRDTPGGFAGLGNRPGRNLLAQMYVTGTMPWTTPLGGRILAHELGHNYGRRHIDQWPLCGTKQPGGPYDSYPYNPCTIGPVVGPTALFGFDPLTWSVIRPTEAGELMTYSPNRWISKPTWDALFGATPGGSGAGGAAEAGAADGGDGLPLPNANIGAPPVLFIHGSIREFENSAELLPFYSLPAGAADARKVMRSFSEAAQLGVASPFKVRLLDGAGQRLMEFPLVTQSDADAEAEPKAAGFTQFLPVDPATRRIQIINGPLVLADRAVSAHVPELVLQPPALDPLGIDLHWVAADADNDPLFFTVQYSTDDGATWEALTTGYPYQEIRVDSSVLPGSATARFRVLATDGFNTALATSDALNIPRHSPQATIQGVRADQNIPFGQPVNLSGMVFDAEEGTISSDRFIWNVTGPSPRAANGSLETLTDLLPGNYTANLLTFDSDQSAAQTLVRWTVLPPTIPDTQGPAPELDGRPDDPAYANALVIRVPRDDGEFARAYLFHADGYVHVCLTELASAQNRQLPPAVGIRFDSDGSQDVFAAPGDIAFFVNRDGLPWEEMGFGQGMMIASQAEHGFSAVIQRGEMDWSAEFKISDGLLGGWNHPIGFMIDLETTQWPSGANGAQPITWSRAYLGTPPAPENRAPIANAGRAQYANATEDTTVYLDGHGSFDPDGDPLTFIWQQVEGPNVGLLEATSATPHFRAPVVAARTLLRFQLVVNDGHLSSASHQTIVTLTPVSQPRTFPEIVPQPLRLVDGQLQLRLRGQPGTVHTIEVSSNLVDWAPFVTRTADFYGALEVVAQVPATTPAQFFRALPALNDSFANRVPIVGESNVVTSVNRGATKEPGEPNHAGNSGGASLWWTWTAPHNGPVTISTAGSDFDTLLAVYAAESIREAALVAADDNSAENFTSRVTFNAIANATYQIAVDGSNGATGRIRLTVSMP